MIGSNQYIFCINTGRAGSEYLSNVLATAKRVWAKHEPEPKMTGEFLDMITESEYDISYQKRKIKTDSIKKTMRWSINKSYIETNHMFIKTFFDVVVGELKNVKVVFLKRNLVDTLNSFYQLGYFSDRNDSWKRWMVSPEAKTAALPCLLEGDERDDVGLSIAYLIDIYCRGYRFMEANPSIPVFEIDLSDLNDERKVFELFDALKLKPTESTRLVVGERKNNRQARKDKIGSGSVPREFLYERVVAYIARLESAGFEVSSKIII